MTKPWDKQTSFTSENARRARKNATSSKKPQVESTLSRKLRIDLTSVMPGSLWWKNAGGQFSAVGLPDVMGVYRGMLISIEVKRGNNWFSPTQVSFLRKAEKAGSVAVGLLKKDNEWYIIPTTAMGFKGNRKKEEWVKIDYPKGLKNITHWKSRVCLASEQTGPEKSSNT